VITVVPAQEYDTGLRQRGIKRIVTPCIHINKKSGLPFCAVVLLWLLRRGKNAEIECGNVYAGLIPFMLNPFIGCGYRIYTYGSELLRASKNDLWGRLLKRVLKKADTIYALGSFTAALLEKMGIEKTPVIMPPRLELPDSLSRAISSADSIPDPKRSDAPVLLVSIGRFVFHKGHHVILRALALLPPDFHVRLTLIGDGPRRKALHSLASDLDVSDRISIRTGCSDSEKNEIINESDIFIFPSLSTRAGTEGFGIAMLEAMAAGKPVIASEAGGIPEVLDNGNCGVLVKPDDPAALADAIIRLATDMSLCHKIAGNAYARLMERYVWK